MNDGAFQGHAPALVASDEFTSLTGRFRGELLAHCYRMLGSAEEAKHTSTTPARYARSQARQ